MNGDPYEVLALDVMINDRDRGVDLLYPQQFAPVHLARDGKPYCQVGGFNLKHWRPATVSVLRMNICARCLKRQAAAASLSRRGGGQQR